MKSFAAVSLALASMAAAQYGQWAIYCGSSCSDGTLIASGTDVSGSCVSLDSSYDYCSVTADSPIYGGNFWKAIFFQNEQCLVDSEPGYEESNGIFNGSCTSVGPWVNYEVVENA